MLEEIITYIAAYQHIPRESINESSHLIKDLGMSSLDIMQLICAVEERFQIEFDEDELLDLLTVEKISNYLNRKLIQ